MNDRVLSQYIEQFLTQLRRLNDNLEELNDALDTQK